MNRVLFICDCAEQPDTTYDDVLCLEVPLFEDINIDGENAQSKWGSMCDLMSLFSYYGERAYYSISTELIKNSLVKVSSVDAEFRGESAHIRYIFEDGREYIPERPIELGEYSDADIKSILECSRKAARYMYLLKCDLKANMLSFEYEWWG